MESNEIKYEIIKKSDPNFIIPVDSMSFGDGIVTATTSIGDVVFANPLKDGNLENSEWVIRQIGTQLTPNDDGVVSDLGVEVPISPTVASEISAGTTNPDEVVSNELTPVIGNDVPMTQPNDAAPAEVAPVADTTTPTPESNI